MRRVVFLAIVWVMAMVPAVAQHTPADSQTLRDILAELRQLRRELHTTTVTAERIQIALYRMQLQDSAVAKATKTADDAHSKLDSITSERKRVAATVEQWQNALDNDTQPENEHKSMQRSLPGLKARLEQLTTDEGQWQSKSTEADSQLVREQLKLENLHNILDELDAALQNSERATAEKASY